jgi:hypothetical protein
MMMEKRRLTVAILALLLPVVVGCFASPTGTTLAEVDTELDPIAIAAAHVYGELGEDRVVFLRMLDRDEDDVSYLALMDMLEEELAVPVLPESQADRAVTADLPPLTPVDAETGEAGISITIGEIGFDEQGYLMIEVGYARSAVDGGVFQYVLDDTPDGWVIVAILLTGIS